MLLDWNWDYFYNIAFMLAIITCSLVVTVKVITTNHLRKNKANDYDSPKMEDWEDSILFKESNQPEPKSKKT